MGLCHRHLSFICHANMLMCKCQCPATSFRMMWWFALGAWHLCGWALAYQFCRFICHRRSLIIYPTICCVHEPRKTFQTQQSSMKTRSPEGSPIGTALAEGGQCHHDHALIWSRFQHSLIFSSVKDKLPPPFPILFLTMAMRMMSVRVERNTLNKMFYASSADNWAWREDPYSKAQSCLCSMGYG